MSQTPPTKCGFFFFFFSGECTCVVGWVNLVVCVGQGGGGGGESKLEQPGSTASWWVGEMENWGPGEKSSTLAPHARNTNEDKKHFGSPTIAHRFDNDERLTKSTSMHLRLVLSSPTHLCRR